MRANIFSRGKKLKVNSNYFYGKVNLREISSVAMIREAKMYHVFFEKGSRTKIHFHSGGQTLIVTKGKGRLDFYSKRVKSPNLFKVHKTKQISLKVGDVVYIPPKKLHTHGGIKNYNFSHIAINFKSNDKDPKTLWFDIDSKNIVSKIS
ncbi:MAG: cupin [Nitrosopumilaceae archaeon]|nr:cupin domain-containing protein [Nitrosopumilaceae archaeon]NIU00623.1 cupin domain-containing protein [Nitrosopumilaceae archaeon]NIU87009.1 cupin [Nitrosopumilaceae archaeon]NIV66473.1 cupin [Nitrosopumilaceae archaeon]NIX61225.1 cupin [Nitrosopumilaceae archaeon]